MTDIASPDHLRGFVAGHRGPGDSSNPLGVVTGYRWERQPKHQTGTTVRPPTPATLRDAVSPKNSCSVGKKPSGHARYSPVGNTPICARYLPSGDRQPR